MIPLAHPCRAALDDLLLRKLDGLQRDWLRAWRQVAVLWEKGEAIMLEILLLSLAATLACGAILGTGMYDLSKDDPGKGDNR